MAMQRSAEDIQNKTFELEELITLRNAEIKHIENALAARKLDPNDSVVASYHETLRLKIGELVGLGLG
jgi:hypothetical protein